MKASVVILNYNGKSWLEKFLPNVIENTPNAEIVVADNASTDESVSFVKESFPNVKLLELDENTGYAGGYNNALQHVDADIYVLLNSDIEVSKGWLTPILETFEKHPEIGALQPKVLDYKDKTKFEHAGACGGFIDKRGFPFCRGRIFHVLEEDIKQYERPIYTFWSTGACLCIRSEDFHAVNGFDASFFAHMEEIDLCWRLQLNNRLSAVQPKSEVYHVGGGTLSTLSPKKTYLNFRNNLFMLYKNLPSNQLISFIFIRLIMDGLAAGLFLVKLQWEHFIVVLKAHKDFYKNIKQLRVKRRMQPVKKPLLALHGCYPKSIVWAFFIAKRQKWKALDQEWIQVIHNEDRAKK